MMTSVLFALLQASLASCAPSDALLIQQSPTCCEDIGLLFMQMSAAVVSDNIQFRTDANNSRTNMTAAANLSVASNGSKKLQLKNSMATELESIGITATTSKAIFMSTQFGAWFHSALLLHFGAAEPVAAESAVALSQHPAPVASEVLMTWLGHVAGAAVLVLLMCGDDVVWLLPFITGSDDEKRQFGGFYVFCMGFMWLVSFALLFVVEAAGRIYPKLPTEAITEIMSTVLLAVLTVKFFNEWYFDEDEDAQSDAEAETAHQPLQVAEKSKEALTPQAAQQKKAQGDSASCMSFIPKIQLFRRATEKDCFSEQYVNCMGNDKCVSSPNGHGETKETDRPKQLTFSALFLVAFAGNLDNVGVYIPIMLSGVVTPLELLCGDLVAASFIALLTLGLSRFSFITDIITRIPLWVIIAGLTICVGTNAFMTLTRPGSVRGVLLMYLS